MFIDYCLEVLSQIKPVKRDECVTEENDKTRDRNTQGNHYHYGLRCFSFREIGNENNLYLIFNAGV